MNTFHEFDCALKQILTEIDILPDRSNKTLFDRISVYVPPDPSLGDIATNAALVLAKSCKQKPHSLGLVLAERLKALPQITDVTIAGPGFINVRLSVETWYAELANILKAGLSYGDHPCRSNYPINIEYVSANPTGPLHVAHARGAIIGDCLANLLTKAGYQVTREYYINDAGTQIDILARSTYLRYREALGETIQDIAAGFYPGTYLKDVGQALAQRDSTQWLKVDEEIWLPVIRTFAVEQIMESICHDLKALGIEMDRYTSETSLIKAGLVDEALQVCADLNYSYVGMPERPKSGNVPEDWEPYPQMMLRTTTFGDDSDRTLKKSDGTHTYFAHDIAYHLDKFRRGFRSLIDIWGADHAGYVKRMEAAVALITNRQVALNIRLYQLVHLFDGDQTLKMSKRTGQFTMLRDLIDKVGCDVIRFMMLTRRHDQILDFDITKVIETSKDNPVFYVQYAHARCCSVLRHAEEMLADQPLDGPSLATIPFDTLTSTDEMTLIRLMAQWPCVVEAAAATYEPHRIAFYLQDVAAVFHGLWTKGKGDITLRFLITGDHDREHDRRVTLARVALVKAVAIVIASGLTVIGVKPVEELRVSELPEHNNKESR